MATRLVSITIVLFWITMTTLLVRSELWPNHSSLRSLPVEKIAKLMWFHHDASDLVVWSDGRRIGNLRLDPKDPKLRESDGVRVFECSGNLQLRLPGSQRQRISWDSVIEFDASLQMRKLTLGIGMRDVALDRAEITVLPDENRVLFELKDVRGKILKSAEYTLDEQGLKKVLAQVDLDPALFDTIRSSASAKAVVTAHESSLAIRSEKIKTFLIEVLQGGQTLISAHIDELGRVQRVTTLFGYYLMQEDLTP